METDSRKGIHVVRFFLTCSPTEQAARWDKRPGGRWAVRVVRRSRRGERSTRSARRTLEGRAARQGRGTGGMRAHARVRAERSGQRKPLSQRRLLTDCHSLLLELPLELPAEQLTCSPRAAMKALRLTMRRTSSSEVAVTVAQRGLPVISASSPQEDPTRMPAGSVRGSGTRGRLAAQPRLARAAAWTRCRPPQQSAPRRCPP